MMSYCKLQLLLAKTCENDFLNQKNEYDIINASGTGWYPSGTQSHEKMRPKLQQNHSLCPMQRHYVAMNNRSFLILFRVFIFILVKGQ